MPLTTPRGKPSHSSTGPCSMWTCSIKPIQELNMHTQNTRTGGTRQTSTGIIQRATFLLEDFRSANHKFQSPIVPHTHVVSTEQPMVQDKHRRCHIQASASHRHWCGGSWSRRASHCGHEQEVMGVTRPTRSRSQSYGGRYYFCMWVGLQEVTFECDSEILIQALTGKQLLLLPSPMKSLHAYVDSKTSEQRSSPMFVAKGIDKHTFQKFRFICNLDWGKSNHYWERHGSRCIPVSIFLIKLTYFL